MRRLAALLAAAVLAGACGGDGDDSAGPAPSASVTTTTAPAEATSTTAAAPATTAASTAGPGPGGSAAAPTTPAPAAAGPGRPAASCPAIPARPAPREDRSRYTLRIDVKPDQNVVEGDLTVRFTPDLPTDQLVFRLWANSPRTSAAGARLDIGGVFVGGRRVDAVQPDATTVVARPGQLAPGRAIDVNVPWRLTLPGTVSDRISRTGDAIRLGSFFPILAWEPGVGWAVQPATSGFAEASMTPQADFVATVSVPAGLDVLASGVHDGNGRWTATAVNDFAMSVGRFSMASATANAPQPVQVTVGVHQGIAESPAAYASRIVRALEDFARRFGPYPWPTYTLAVTPQLGGGIEYPMHVLQGPGTIGRTTSHEVAHMWFYALVANDQGRDPWMDEGLATYAEGRFEGTLDSIRSTPVPAAGRGHAGEAMTWWEPRQSIYYRSVYTQGAQAIAALGDAELVDCALRVYVARKGYRVARPGDFIEAARAVFPDAAEVLGRYGIRP